MLNRILPPAPRVRSKWTKRRGEGAGTSLIKCYLNILCAQIDEHFPLRTQRHSAPPPPPPAPPPSLCPMAALPVLPTTMPSSRGGWVCAESLTRTHLACLLPPTADGDAEYGKPSTGSTTCMELCEYPRPSAEWVACLYTGERWLSSHLYREA